MKNDIYIRCMATLLVSALVGLSSCSKDSWQEEPVLEPQNGQQVNSGNETPADADTYTLSVPATFAQADTRALTIANEPVYGKEYLQSEFSTSDKVYVYDVTKSKWGSTNLTPSAAGVSCTLNGNIKITGAAVGDVIKLYYNINSSSKTYSYTDQKGLLNTGTNPVSKYDFAVAAMKIKSIDGSNVITLCDPTDDTNETAVFENLQSIFKFTFNGLHDNKVKSVTIHSAGVKLVTVYDPIGTGTTYGDITITPASANNNYIYAALRFDALTGEYATDELTFTVTGNDNTVYKYVKQSPLGGFSQLGGYYDTAIPMEVDLSNISADYTAQNYDILTGSFDGGSKIIIPDGATVSFHNLTFNYTGSGAAVVCQGSATIIPTSGNENVITATNSPAILNESGKMLTIFNSSDRTGSLSVTGGSGHPAIKISNTVNKTVNLDDLTKTEGIVTHEDYLLYLKSTKVTATGGSGAPGISVTNTLNATITSGSANIKVNPLLYITGGETGSTITATGTGSGAAAAGISVVNTLNITDNGNSYEKHVASPLHIDNGVVTATGGSADAKGISVTTGGSESVHAITLSNGIKMFEGAAEAPTSPAADQHTCTKQYAVIRATEVEADPRPTSP